MCVLHIYKDGGRYLVYMCIYGGKECSCIVAHLQNVSQPHPCAHSLLELRHFTDQFYQHVGRTHTHRLL